MGTRNGIFWDSENRATDQSDDSSSSTHPKKMGCAGDKYDVVSGSGGAPRTEASSFKAPFTAAQRQELQRQSAIFKYMVSSVPVPPELLVPISKTSSISPSPRSNVGRGSIELGLSGNSDPEPWRCRRTDGKKWRCSRDVAPDQKYCERHTHKGRPRSRKPVELTYDFTHKNTTINNNNKTLANQREIDGLCSFPSSGFDQPRCSDWFINAIASTPNQEWHQRTVDPLNHLNGLQQNLLIGSIDGLNQIQTQETIRFIDEIGNQRGSVSSSLTLAVTSGEENEIEEMGRERSNWMGPVSWASSNSPPGGPLAEALCLGISSSSKLAPTSSSGDGARGLMFD